MDNDNKENSGREMTSDDRLSFQPGGEGTDVETISMPQLKERLSCYLPDAKIDVFRMSARNGIDVANSFFGK